MQALGEYAVALTAAALINAILLSLFPEGTIQKLLRLICGLVLTVTALTPLPGIRLPEVTIFREEYLQGQDLAAQGEDMAADAAAERITQMLDAYILDKAGPLQMQLQSRFRLDHSGLPVGITLCGTWSQEAQSTLSDIITKDLGIPEEDQQWNEEISEKGSWNGSQNTGGPS